MLLVTPDIAAMYAAIDDGDDGTLPIMADALEEAGDVRAAGVRILLCAGYQPYKRANSWCWHNAEAVVSEPWLTGASILPFDIYRRLRGGNRSTLNGHEYMAGYPKMSDAYLALAEAMTSQN